MRFDMGATKERGLGALILLAIPAVRWAIDVLSGSLLRDAGLAIRNLWWLVMSIPSWLLFFVAVGLLLYDPLRRLYDQRFAQTPDLQVYPQADSLRPAVEQATETSNPLIGHNPGQLGSASIGNVMLLRQRLREGKFIQNGLGKYSYPDPIPCPLCSGKGNKWGYFQGDCHQCEGTGQLPGELTRYVRCKSCNGNGHKDGMYQADCPTCFGLGYRGVDPEILRAIKGKSIQSSAI